MMFLTIIKRAVLFVFISLSSIINAQNTIDWDGIYKLQLNDFQSKASQIGGTNIYSLSSIAGMDFSFYMSNYEFMFTKNFNSKVNCTFNRTAASLVAPDSLIATDLLTFARFEFDLAELYARKLRKKLYEEKSTFSDISFFRPVYDDVQREFSERQTLAGKETDLGRDRQKLEALHQEVLSEIEQLAEFCKSCKPPKKKK